MNIKTRFKSLKLRQRYVLVGMVQQLPDELIAIEARMPVEKVSEIRQLLLKDHSELLEVIIERIAKHKRPKEKKRKPTAPLRTLRRNRAVGLCYCGAFHEGETIACDQCRKRAQKNGASRYKELKKLGICVGCRSPEKQLAKSRSGKPLRHCQECREKVKKQNADRYVARKRAGMCTQCGKRRPLPGLGRCQTCKDAHAITANAHLDRKRKKPKKKYTKPAEPRAYITPVNDQELALYKQAETRNPKAK